jgi:Ca2+-binding RTX toxin-like protein
MMRIGSVMVWQMALLGVVGMACGSPASDPENPLAANAGSGAAGGASTGGGSAGSAAHSSSNGGGSGPSGDSLDPIVTLPGVAEPLDVPPSGCVRGFHRGSLELALDSAVSSVELRAEAGVLLANGTACSDSAGTELVLGDLLWLQVTAGSEDNSVSIDLGSGDWSALLGSAEGVLVDLGGGENELLIRGTTGDDHYRHAMRGPDVVLDLLGNGTIDAVGSGLRKLGFSLGDGDDRLEDLSTVLAAAEPLSAPPTESAALSALSLPLVVSGGAGNDWLVGGTADDEFDGGAGDDVVSGLAGSDRFVSDLEGDGRDIWNGGPGYDQISYELRSTNLELEVCVSQALIGCSGGECVCEVGSGEADEGDWIVNVEDLRGGGGDDILRGSEASESLRGGPGDDSLFGFGGSDLLSGDRGVDDLEGGADGDICDGQPGDTMTGCEL